MKIELGGGNFPRGDGFINVDVGGKADVIHNLNVHPWPFDDDSVTDVYTCHCVEHLNGVHDLQRELCRVCKIGAQIEIRTPFPNSDLAMVWDHKHVYSPLQAINEDVYFPSHIWKGPKRMRLDRMELHPTVLLEEAKNDLPFLRRIPDQIIMKWIPRTCHETRFFFTVIENEYYPKAETAEAIAVDTEGVA